jgi:hypothetical protein
MLKRAKRWIAIADDVRPLKEPRSIRRALSYEEFYLFRVEAKRCGKKSMGNLTCDNLQ